jgi:chitinase
VRGVVPLTGNARGDFDYWWVQYGAGLFPTEWVKIEGNRGEQIDNGLLQNWDTSALDGLYTVQLVVLKKDGAFENSTLQVTVDNQPPTVSLLAPAPNAEYTVGRDDFVIIQPQADDNFSLARVEFYVDGALADTALAPPYSTRWKVDFGAEGQHTVFVRAFDAASNSTDSAPVTFTVK